MWRVDWVTEEGCMMVVGAQRFLKREALIVPFTGPLGLDAVAARRLPFITLDAPFTAS